MRLERKRALITGAASGMGRFVAVTFAAEGASVALVDIDEAGLHDVAAEIRAGGAEALTHTADISSAGDWETIASALTDEWGSLDILYNNAAVFFAEDGPVTEMPVETWERTMAVNAGGVFLSCKYMIPLMRAAGGGSIINVASIRARRGASAPQDAYTAAKGAVLGLTVSLAAYLARDGIRVNAISPGTIVTPMAPIGDPEAAAHRLTRYPLGRFGEPADVAGAALYLASDESRWTTGIELPVDGGTSAFYV